MAKILCVEDDKLFTRSLCALLRTWGHDVHVALGDMDVVNIAGKQHFDLAIFEWNLPNPVSGFYLFRQIKKLFPSLGILVIAAEDDIEDKIKAFRAGADEYIVKMPEIAEIRARIEALIRRLSTPSPSINGKLLFGPIELDPIDYRASVHGSSVELTLTQFRILAYMLRNLGRAIGARELRENIFRSAESEHSSKLRYHICELRRRLGPSGQLIRHYARQGYGLGVDLTPVDETSQRS